VQFGDRQDPLWRGFSGERFDFRAFMPPETKAVQVADSMTMSVVASWASPMTRSAKIPVA